MNTKKNFLTIVALFSTMSFLIAQNESLEAEKLIKQAQEAIQSNNYVEASKILQKAKDELSKSLSNQLALSLPLKFDNFTQNSDKKSNTSREMPMGMRLPGASELICIRTYELEAKKEEKKEEKKAVSVPPAIKTDSMAGRNSMPAYPPPNMYMPNLGLENGKSRIIVTISNNNSVATSIANINSGSNATPIMATTMMGGGEESKAIKIKNYRASSRYNKIIKSGEADKISGEVAIIVGAGVVQIQGSNVDSIETLEKFADQIDFQKIKALFGE